MCRLFFQNAECGDRFGALLPRQRCTQISRRQAGNGYDQECKKTESYACASAGIGRLMMCSPAGFELCIAAVNSGGLFPFYRRTMLRAEAYLLPELMLPLSVA